MASSPITFNSGIFKNNHLVPFLICPGLVIITVAAFNPTKDSGFINLDGNRYIYENATVQSSLNRNSMKPAFSFELAKRSGYWHPLIWLSWMADYAIFGFKPFGYQMFNLLFHIINTIVIFLIPDEDDKVSLAECLRSCQLNRISW